MNPDSQVPQPSPETPSAPESAELKESKKLQRFRALFQALGQTEMRKVPTEVPDQTDLAALIEYVEAGGRIPGVTYEPGKREAGDGFDRAEAYLEREFYSVVNGKELKDADDVNPKKYYHPNPNDPSQKYGAHHALNVGAVNRVLQEVEVSRQTKIPEWDGWGNIDKRISVTDRVIARMYHEGDTMAALFGLSGGKSGGEGPSETFRDSQEFFDFANNYRMVKEALALQQIVLRSNGDTSISARKLDKIVGIWPPYNFPCIGWGEMLSALIAGNTAVVHASARMVPLYMWFFDILRKEGVPTARIHFVVPHGNDEENEFDSDMSAALSAHPLMGNIYFTGSHDVAKKLDRTQAKKRDDLDRLDIKLNAEAGGYGPMVIESLPEGALDTLNRLYDTTIEGSHPTESEWDVFIEIVPTDSFLASFMEAIIDSACGLQGAKCSALHEVIIQICKEGVNGLTPQDADRLQAFIVAILNRVKVGDVTKDKDARMGSLIDKRMHTLVQDQVKTILDRGGEILTGDGTLEDRMNVDALPNAMKPIVYVDSNREPGNDVEIFAPVFRINKIEGKGKAMERAKSLKYALTVATYASTTERAIAMRDELPHGVGYPNGENYAPTTTAAPAPQIPFGGIFASGTASGLFRPGNGIHVLQFLDLYSKAEVPRSEWGNGKAERIFADLIESALIISGIRLDMALVLQDMDAILEAANDPTPPPAAEQSA